VNWQSKKENKKKSSQGAGELAQWARLYMNPVRFTGVAIYPGSILFPAEIYSN